MQKKIQSLLAMQVLQCSADDLEKFHHEFSVLLQISPAIAGQIRRLFNFDTTLLSFFRKAYLWEMLANDASTIADKLFCYSQALQVLKMDGIVVETIPIDVKLFLCHNLAKLHYEIGVLWMQIVNEMDEDFNLVDFLSPPDDLSYEKTAFINVVLSVNITPNQHAIASFERASLSYESFKNQCIEESFFDLSNAWHEKFELLDCYSPLARMISIDCNYFLCLQDDEEKITTSTLILESLKENIEKTPRSRQFNASASGRAVDEVKLLLESFQGSSPAPSLLKSADINEGFGRLGKRSAVNHEESTSSKRRKKPKATLNKIEEIVTRWHVRVKDKSDFNAALNDFCISPGFLRARQQQDLNVIYQYLPGGDGKPLIVTKPTGTGKTAEFCALANNAWSVGLPTIIVVPTAALVEQTQVKLEEYRKHNGMHYNPSDITIYCPTKRKFGLGPITIVTQASYVIQAKIALKKFPDKASLWLYIQMNRISEKPPCYFEKEVFFHPDFFSLLLIDEGHHMEGEGLFQLMTRAGCEKPQILFSASTLPRKRYCKRLRRMNWPHCKC